MEKLGVATMVSLISGAIPDTNITNTKFIVNESTYNWIYLLMNCYFSFGNIISSSKFNVIKLLFCFLYGDPP